MAESPYTYTLAKIVRVVDGDTVDLSVTKTMDVGFKLVHTSAYTGRFRVVVVQCPEQGDEGYAEAKTFTTSWLMGGPKSDLTVTTYKDPDNFGRYLADISLPDGQTLSEALLASGHAVPYVRRGQR